MAGDVTTPAGHALRGAARKGVRRRWVCERCDAVVVVSPALSLDEAAVELARQARAHGAEGGCP